MNDERIEQKRIVLDTPGERREVITETSRSEPSEFKLSPGTIGLIAVLAIVVIGMVIYVVSNKNANEAANRETAIQASREQVPAPIVQQQPAAAPIIIQQPVPAQQAPVIIQQPAQPIAGTVIDDATMNEVATKRLADDPGLASVSVAIREGRAVLTGTVNSAAIKVSAEQLVRDVRGVKSVDNRIVLSTP